MSSHRHHAAATAQEGRRMGRELDLCRGRRWNSPPPNHLGFRHRREEEKKKSREEERKILTPSSTFEKKRIYLSHFSLRLQTKKEGKKKEGTIDGRLDIESLSGPEPKKKREERKREKYGRLPLLFLIMLPAGIPTASSRKKEGGKGEREGTDELISFEIIVGFDVEGGRGGVERQAEEPIPISPPQNSPIIIKKERGKERGRERVKRKVGIYRLAVPPRLRERKV